MGKLIFITGGARSGKSSYALELAAKKWKNVVFIATCVPQDGEMRERVKLHISSRPKHWKTVEEPLKTHLALAKLPAKTDTVILDCLTLLVSNLLLSGKSEGSILLEIKKTINAAKKRRFVTVLISNEVGMGIVPENALGRLFRDVAGKVNQLVAKASDEAYIMVAGYPLPIKGAKSETA